MTENFVRRFGPQKEPPNCHDCGEPQEWVDEPVISGFRGFVCTNSDCPRDQ